MSRPPGAGRPLAMDIEAFVFSVNGVRFFLQFVLLLSPYFNLIRFGNDTGKDLTNQMHQNLPVSQSTVDPASHGAKIAFANR